MSRKQEKQPPQDLSALEDSFRIVGELSAREHVHEFLATRVDTGEDVQILVAESPRGDAGNALTLYAADVNLLRTLEHRNLIPIQEVRWVGQDRLAVVTRRTHAPTLGTLIARGDGWSYPRIATILHEIHGVLEWARKQKVVHRALTLDTVHLEPDSDRVLVSFVAQPLTRHGAPAEDGDARTVAQLAWALITRGRELPEGPEQSLGVVRPELPQRVVEATDALLHGVRSGTSEPPAVPDYIGLVAMTDLIAQAEREAAELQAVIYQERELERDTWAAKVRDYQDRMDEQDRTIAAEREEMERTLAAERQQLADERAEMERVMADEREQLAATLAAERQEMADHRAELERQIADEREQMDRQIASERQELATLRAELERQIADEREQMDRQITAERQELATLRAELERQIADEREQMDRTLADERTQLEQTLTAERTQLAAEKAALENLVAEEREQMRRTIAEERARLEQTLADEREKLQADRTEAETALATAREEFEEAIHAQREEFDARLAAEREEFDRLVIAERNALEADKEGFAVYHAAERDAIAAERRALEELYLAYEAEGGTIEALDDDDGDGERSRVLPLTGGLADLAPAAVAQPVVEPPDPSEGPAETESGMTRSDAKRSRRASWGVPASVLLLVAVIAATAVGVGATREAQREARSATRPAATPSAPRVAAPAAPGVLDSAGGAIAPTDSLTAVPQGDALPPATPEIAPRSDAAAPRRRDAGPEPPRRAPPSRTVTAPSREPPIRVTPAAQPRGDPEPSSDTAVVPAELPQIRFPIPLPPLTVPTRPPSDTPTTRDPVPTPPFPPDS